MMYQVGQVRDKLHNASMEQSAFDVTVPQNGLISSSLPINVNIICVKDGDGTVLQEDCRGDDPIVPDSSAVHTRLNRIDTPELFAIHYVRSNETPSRAV